MEIHSKIAKDLSAVLGKKFDKLTIANEQALSTIDPSSGRIFTLEYMASGKTYGNVTVNIVDPSTLVVYYKNNITEDMRYDDKKDWYAFLKELRYFAKRNLMSFDVRNIGKQQLDKQDYAYIKTNMTSPTSDTITMEGKMFGSLKTSYQHIGEVRLVVKHRKPVDEEKRGSRTRQIHSIYVEDSSKNRTKIPYTYLAGGRALAQHINQGGTFEDQVGLHILDMIQEVIDLKKFVKSFRRADNFAEQDEATKIIEQARERAIGLNSTLKTLSGPKGYQGYVKQYEPTDESIQQADLDDIRSKLTRIHKDNVVDSVLPSLARGLKAMENMKVVDKEADDYAEFEKEMDKKKASSVADVIAFSKSNDDIEILDVPDQVDKLKSELDMIKVKKFDKDEEKNKAQKNRNILKSVMDYLELNVADDAMGNAIAQLDQDNAEQRAAAMRLAMKYLKGKTKKISKAKKDLYGKDKTESAQFENWANNIIEGTWAIPDTQEDVDKIADLMKNPLPLGPEGQDATNAVSAAIGDDELFDDLYMAGEKDPNADARPIIKDWIMKNIQGYDGMPADLIQKLMDIVQGKEQMDLPLEDQQVIDEDDIEEGSIKYMHSLKAKGKSIEEIAKELDMEPDEVKAAMAKTESITTEAEEPVMFKGKQIDTSKVDYDMVDISDGMIELNSPVFYTDGTEVAEEDMAELNDNQDMIEWMTNDYMDNVAPQAEQKQYDTEMSELRRLAFGIEEDDTDYPQVVNRNIDKKNVMDILNKYPEDTKKMQMSGDLMDIYDTDLYLDLFDYYSEDMPYGTMKGRDGDPVQYISDELDDLGLLEDKLSEGMMKRMLEIEKVYPKIAKMKMALVDGGMEPEDAHDEACEKYGVDPDMCDKYIEFKRSEREDTMKEDEGFDIRSKLTPKQIEDAENDGLDLDDIDEQMYNNMTKDPMQIKKDIQDEIEEFLDYALGADDVPVDDVFYDFGDYRSEVILFADDATKKAYFEVRGIDDEDDVEGFIESCRIALADLGRIIKNDELADMQDQARKQYESKEDDDAFKQRMLELAGL